MAREDVTLQISVKKEHLDTFIEEWNKFLKGNNKYLDEDNLLDRGYFEEDTIEPDAMSYLGEEMANLFDMPNDTGILDFCKDILRNHPDMEFDIQYDLEWDNCGDVLIEYYFVKPGRIDYETMDGEFFCDEDEYDDMEEEVEEAEEEGDTIEQIDGEGPYYIIRNHQKGTADV